ncbi:DUF2263 domain-containing protein [Stagonosporopsis vannaccii]|nr:DUF2263 domain-containing protein [Stagonosporopsis vannaccii]
MQQSSITGFFKKAPQPHPSGGNEHRSNSDRQERRPGPYRSRGAHSTPSTRGQHRGGKSPRNMELRKIAQETKDVLPAVLKSLPGFGADVSSIHDLSGTPALDASDCPGYVLPTTDKDAGKAGTRIRVLDKDSFDAAIELQPNYKARLRLRSLSAAAASGSANNISHEPTTPDSEEMDLDGLPLHQPQPQLQPPIHPWDLSKPVPNPAPQPLSPTTTTSHSVPQPVLVLNLASERHAGGGWQTGAMAQEEALCYRSSLYLSLHKSYYPLPSLSCIYTPSVLLIRSATSAGHTLYNAPAPDLPVASVLSVAALRHPGLTDDGVGFKSAGQRAETKRKIRVCLRVAARARHRKLVLGALGCGVFANPPEDVARCFLEVLRETEFEGGWWESVVFAVMDNARDGKGGQDGEGNFGHFYRVLDGEVV